MTQDEGHDRNAAYAISRFGPTCSPLAERPLPSFRYRWARALDVRVLPNRKVKILNGLVGHGYFTVAVQFGTLRVHRLRRICPRV